MITSPSILLKEFFEKNLFERLIIYILASSLIVTIIFQFGLGQDSYDQSQNKQWVFYGLLGLDYLISFRKVLNLRITINPISLFALCLFIMMFHGIFVGILNANAPFVIFNDTVPILMIALNILRMQSVSEISKPINFRFLYISTVICVSITCVFGALSGKVFTGNPSLVYPLLFVPLFILRPFPVWTIPFVLGVFIFTADDINRTTLMFFLIIFGIYMGFVTIREPMKSLIVGLCAIIAIFGAFSFLPEDSKTYERVVGLTEIDLSKRTGSIGERQAERDAINTKLEKMGTAAQWTGAGFGGTYTVRFTWEFMRDYGHAHYAWAWYNLRFGKIGYFYMFIFASMIIYSGIHNYRQKNDVGLFVTCLCISALLYMMTHVNSIWLLSGLHFLYQLPKNLRSTEEK